MPNPYYVAPLGGYDPAQGIREVFQGFRAGSQKRQAKRDQKRAEDLFANEQSKKNLGETAIRYFAGEDPRSLIAERADFVLKQGGDPSDTLALADVDENTFRSRMKAALAYTRPDMYQQFFPNEFKKSSKVQFGGQNIFKDEEGNLFYGTSKRNADTGDVQSVLSPISQNQPKKPVGKVSQTGSYGLTATEKVGQTTEEERAKSNVKLEEEKELTDILNARKRNEAVDQKQVDRLDNYISKGLDSIGRLNRVNKGLELIDKVDTGGLTARAKTVTDFFGTTSGDVAELNKILAENVLAGLENFSGAISEGERDFLERMETNLRAGKEFNKRELKRMQRELRKRINFAIKAAKANGDNFALDVLQSNDFDPIAPVQQKSSGINPEPITDEELYKQYGIPM